MISFGRMTPGHAGYFEGEVAAGREDYYAGRGESPGVWKGSGAAGIGLEGRVLEGQLSALFEMRNPLTGDPLGNVGYKVAETYVDQFGVEQVRHKRSGFDATFSVPKSVSLLYAYGDTVMQGHVLDASQAAVDAALTHLEAHAAFSRTGKGGVNQVDTDGLIVGQFMHRTSRAGDPQLHFHLLVSNRVRCVTDGKWRALDGRPLHAELKTAGMIGQAVLRAELQHRLGVAWEPVSEHGQAEIVGVPAELMELQSKRTRAVEAHAGAAIAEAEADLGRVLTPAERAEKYDNAAVQTRAVKSRHLEAIEGLHDRWAREAVAAGFDPAGWLDDVALPPLGAIAGEPQPTPDDDLVTAVLEELTEQHSTWKRSDATRVFARLIPTRSAVDGAAVAARIEALTDTLMGRLNVVEISPPVDLGGPVRASDGRPLAESHHSRVFTTLETLRREQAVLDHVEAGRNSRHAVVDDDLVDAVVDGAERPLSPDQADAVRYLTTSGNAVTALVGPAGAGKSTTIGTAAQAFTAAGIPVRGLAISAVAAAVLREEAGINNADTLAKLLHEHRSPTGPGDYAIRPDEVLIVDEASMVPTADLARLIDLAKPAGAQIVLVGDYRQLGAINAGGMFRHIAQTTGVARELDTVWRFTNPWEQTASLQLRHSDPAVIDTYTAHGRVHGGHKANLIDDAFSHWAEHDPTEVIVTAPDRATVADFNQRARHHLQTNGRLGRDVLEHAGRRYAIGDQVITGHNDRRILTNTGRYVRNGDRWTINGMTDNNQRLETIAVTNPAGEHAVLPAVYLQRSPDALDHAYATTIHKAQGVTVGHAITILGPTATAEGLYVAATRGRHSNHIYVDTTPDESEYGPLEHAPTPTDALRRVLTNQTADRTATQTLIDNTITPPAPAKLETWAHNARQLLEDGVDPYTALQQLAYNAPSVELLAAAIEPITNNFADIATAIGDIVPPEDTAHIGRHLGLTGPEIIAAVKGAVPASTVAYIALELANEDPQEAAQLTGQTLEDLAANLNGEITAHDIEPQLDQPRRPTIDDHRPGLELW